MEKARVRDPIPEFQTLEEIAEFWDKHSTADYEDLTEEVQFEVKVGQKPKPVFLLPELLETLEGQAQARGVSVETLANLWLVEKVREAT
jgi:predicted house-cleaning noncanonical NTP pyrophosphatase (MazG superfamily)